MGIQYDFAILDFGCCSTRNLKEEVGVVFRSTCSTHRVTEVISDLDRSLRAEMIGTLKVTNGSREGTQLLSQSSFFHNRN